MNKSIRQAKLSLDYQKKNTTKSEANSNMKIQKTTSKVFTAAHRLAYSVMKLVRKNFVVFIQTYLKNASKAW